LKENTCIVYWGGRQIVLGLSGKHDMLGTVAHGCNPSYPEGSQKEGHHTGFQPINPVEMKQVTCTCHSSY
jgi:hypothetical protein